ncbi:hypothetical protein RvY_05788-3 [Ramazzottius varieornatus]|nr:hypothetical protein RvY_05788-3 [Ramazzottius varieornatus]
MWVSVNEEMINKAYALVFLGHWANSIAPVVYHHGIQAVVAAAPEAFVQSATTSWISLFGLCWVLACLYHKVMTLWFRSMQIGFTAAQERDHAALKFELSGCFYLFLWLGDVLDMDRQLTVIHVSRMMFFFVLFKLATIPSVSGQVAQTQALEGSGSGLNYSKYVVEGSIVPAALGIFLLDRVWRAPLVVEPVIHGTWMTDKTSLFPSDFEMWMHGETFFCSVDLAFQSLHTAVNSVAAYGHLEADYSAPLCHILMEKTDWLFKLWSLFLRHILNIVLQCFTLTLLWENRTDVFYVSFMYFFRIFNCMEYLHEASVGGVSGQFFCWSRCVIKALVLPTESQFAEWNDRCSICQLEDEDHQLFCTFPCGHIFHRECIEQWLKVRMCCPLCMRGIRFRHGRIKMDKSSF